MIRALLTILAIHALSVSAKVWGGFEDSRLDTAGSTTPSLNGIDRGAFLEIITNAGFDVALTDEVTSEFLDTVDVFYPSVISRAPEEALSESEVSALKSWVEAGGILIGVIDGGLGFAAPYESILQEFDFLSVTGSFSGFVRPQVENTLTAGVEELVFNLGSSFTVHDSQQQNAQILFANDAGEAAIVLLEHVGAGNGALVFIGDSTLIRDDFIRDFDNQLFFLNLARYAFEHERNVVSVSSESEGVVEREVIPDEVDEEPVQNPVDFIPSTDACTDDLQFRDSGEDDCLFYEANVGECLHASEYTNAQGKDATDSCCICGGGTDFTRDILRGIVTLQTLINEVGRNLGLDFDNLKSSIRNVQNHLESSISDSKEEIQASIADLSLDLQNIAASLSTGNDDLKTTIRAVEASLVQILNTNSADLNDVRDSISALSTSVAAVQDALTSQILAQSAEISSLQTTLTDVNAGIDQRLITVTGDMASLKESVASVQGVLSEAVQARNLIIASCESLGEQIRLFREFVGEHDSDIDQTLADQGTRISDMERTLNTLQNLLEPLQQSLSTRFAEIHAQFDSDFEALNEKIDAVNETIKADLAEALHLHSDISYLTQDLVDDTEALATQIGEVGDSVGSVGASVQNLDTEFAEIDANVADLDNDIGVVDDTLEEMKITLGRVNVDVGNIHSEVFNIVGQATENQNALLAELNTKNSEIISELDTVSEPIGALATQLTAFQTSLMQFQGDVGPVVSGIPQNFDDIKDSIDDLADTLDDVGNLLNEFRQGVTQKFTDQNTFIADKIAAQSAAFESRLNEVETGCASQNDGIAALQDSILAVFRELSTLNVEREVCRPFGGTQDDDGSLVCCLDSCGKCDDGPSCGTRAGGAHDCCVPTILEDNNLCGENEAPCVMG